MKLIKCPACGDMVALRPWRKSCQCGLCYGRFLEDNRTVVVAPEAVVLGVPNELLFEIPDSEFVIKGKRDSGGVEVGGKVKAGLCKKIDECFKIRMLRDKDWAGDWQFAEAVEAVCGKCDEKVLAEVDKCPIGLDPIHCQNCYFQRDGECCYLQLTGKPVGTKGGRKG